jgi:hypothetical protein
MDVQGFWQQSPRSETKDHEEEYNLWKERQGRLAVGCPEEILK